MANIAKRHYEDFDPFSELKSEEEFDTLLIHLPGFKKEQLNVQVTSSRILKIRGERPVSDDKWMRFRKEFHLPSNIDTHEIIPKFLEGILHIRQAKLATPEIFEQGDHQAQKPAEEIAPEPQPQVLQQEIAPAEEKDEAGELSEAPKSQVEEQPPAPQPQILEHEAYSEETKDEAGETSEAPKPQMQELPSAAQPQILEQESSEDKTGEMTGQEDEMDKQLEHGGGIFEELRRPEQLKRLVINVIVLLIVLVYFISKMFMSFTKKVEEPSIEEYDKEL